MPALMNFYFTHSIVLSGKKHYSHIFPIWYHHDPSKIYKIIVALDFQEILIVKFSKKTRIRRASEEDTLHK